METIIELKKEDIMEDYFEKHPLIEELNKELAELQSEHYDLYKRKCNLE